MTSMNYLVFLNAQAGELEKILSGRKSMIVKEFDPARPTDQAISPGDNLYFLRNKDESALRVKATVVRVLSFTNHKEDDLCQPLKELQPRLQLTEEQYKEKEAEFTGKHISAGDYVVLLDEKGKEYRSVDFARYLQNKMLAINNKDKLSAVRAS